MGVGAGVGVAVEVAGCVGVGAGVGVAVGVAGCVGVGAGVGVATGWGTLEPLSWPPSESATYSFTFVGASSSKYRMCVIRRPFHDESQVELRF